MWIPYRSGSALGDAAVQTVGTAALTNLPNVEDIQNQQGIFLAATGSSGAYAITLIPAITAYVEGQRFVVKANHDCPVNPTLNVNAKGAGALVNPDGSGLAAGAIRTDQMFEVVRRGSDFQVISPQSIAIAVATQAESEAGTDNTKIMTPLRTAQAIDGYGGRPEDFTVDGTYQVPDGVTEVLLEARGGGGGGAGGTGGGGNQGGGGGAGGEIVAKITVTPGGSETVLVGQGGAGGAPNVNGSPGTNSTVGSTKVIANGGAGGNQAGPGGAGGSFSSTGTAVKTRTGGSGNAGPSGLGGLADFNSPTTASGQGGRGTLNGSGLAGVDGYVIITPLI